VKSGCALFTVVIIGFKNSNLVSNVSFLKNE
jgi:hypothetical protein